MPRCSPRSRETAPLTAAALHGTARLTGEQEKNDQIARAEVAGRNLARPLTRPTSISVSGALSAMEGRPQLRHSILLDQLRGVLTDAEDDCDQLEPQTGDQDVDEHERWH